MFARRSVLESYSRASWTYSKETGTNSTASGNYSTAIGYGSSSSNDNEIAIGSSTASILIRALSSNEQSLIVASSEGVLSAVPYGDTVYDATNVAITGGTIDGTSIGATDPSTGNFTEVTVGETTIHDSGISVNDKPLITQATDGSVHLGENSLITKEVNGRQQLYSRNANGKAIPIDITNGTKLLINGRDVEQGINNVGALSAALTGLPTVPNDTPLACGIGTGTHGGEFAIAGGCASKVNERLAFNFAGSVLPTGQDYLGNTENAWSGRAGFVYQFGEKSISKKDVPNVLKIQIEQVKDLKDKLLVKDKEIAKLKNDMKVENREIKNSAKSQNKLIAELEKKLLEQEKLLKQLLKKLGN